MNTIVHNGHIFSERREIEGTYYDSFGININIRGEEHAVGDISADRDFVEKLLDNLIRCGISAVHLREFIEDEIV